MAALRHPKGAKLSDRAIAKHVSVSDRTVARYRSEATTKVSESAERTGLDGRTIDTATLTDIQQVFLDSRGGIG
jgi:predicted transcriptional regulator